MKKAIFILVVGVLSATLYSCSPSELEIVSPIVSKTDAGNREGDTVGEDGSDIEEEDGTGNREGDTVGEDGSDIEEEDGTGK